MSHFNESTYHSGENNRTTGREPFEDTSRDFIHGGGNNTHAIPGTFGAGVGNTSTTTSHTTGTSHHTGTGLTGAGTGAGLTGGRHGTGRRGSSSSSSSSSEEEVDGVRRKKDRTNRPKKPVGEKIKDAVGMGGAGAGTGAASGVAGSHQGQHDSRGMAPGTAGVTGVHQGASHGLSSLHGQRDAYNETAETRGDIRTGTSSDPAVGHSSGLGGLSGATRQTGDAPGGIQSGNTSYGTGHNLASEARDHTTGAHHTGTGVGSGVGAGGVAGAAASHLPGHGSSTTGQYGSNTSASNYASTTDSSHTHGLGHTSGTGLGSSTTGHTGSGLGEDRSAGYARNQGGPGNQGITGNNLSGAAGTDRFDVDRSSSGANTGSYGHQQDTGVSRHGITGDFDNNATAPTGGAYSNPDAKTGLTGREHTTTGVSDQHGHATEQHQGGLLDKVKAMLPGHSSTTTH